MTVTTDRPVALSEWAEGWEERAVCRNRPHLMEARTPDDEQAALALCYACPVRVECLDRVMDLRPGTDHEMVAGGTTYQERSSDRMSRAALARSAAKKAERAAAPPATGPKWCGGCQERRPREEFARNQQAPDGLQYWCRACQRRAKAESRARRRAEVGGVKECTACTRLLPADEFMPDRRMGDGLRSWCRGCDELEQASAAG